jgi:hypothetical protein
MIIEFNVEYTVFTTIAEEATKAKRTISEEVIELIKEVTSQDGFKPQSTILSINSTASINATISVIFFNENEIDLIKTLIEHSNVLGLSLSNYMANLTKFIVVNYIRIKRIDNNYRIGSDYSINPRFTNSECSTKFISPIDLNAYNFNAHQGFDKTSSNDWITISSIMMEVFKQQYPYSIKLSSAYELPSDIVLKTNDVERFDEYKKDITDWYVLLATFIAKLMNSDIEEYNGLKDKVIEYKNHLYCKFLIAFTGIYSPLEYLRIKQEKDRWRVTKSKGSLHKWNLYLVYNEKEDKVNIYFPNIIRIDDNEN